MWDLCARCLRVHQGCTLQCATHAASRRPWIVKEQDACFVVRDHGGQQLAYVYFEDKSGRRSAAHLLTR